MMSSAQPLSGSGASFGPELRLDALFGLAALLIMIASVAISPFRYFSYMLPAAAVLVMLANRIVSVAISPFRYFGYMPPATTVPVMLANRKMQTVDLARPYLLLISAGLLLGLFANKEGIKDLYLILAGLSAALVGFSRLWSWRTIFVACVLGLAVQVVLVGASDGLGAIASSFTIDIALSRSSLESGFSYVFGLLAVWALCARRWRDFTLAFVLAVLTLKRIVIIGIILCAAVQFLPVWLRMRLLRPGPMLLANALFLFMILSYGSGAYDALIVQLTSQSADQLGMGRQALYSHIVADILHQPMRFIFYGKGPGDVYDVLAWVMRDEHKANLHGDTLKVLYEYGAIVLSLFIAALYSSRRFGVLLVALYTNILFLTDNTLIYPYYIYFATLVSACLADAEDASNGDHHASM